MTLAAVLAALLAVPAERRIPAYTAYLAPDADASRISANRPVMPFARAGVTLAWFGRFTTTGAVTAAVAVQLAAGDSVRLRLTVGAERREATAVGGTGESRVSFGSFVVADTGYQRFELATADGRAAPAAEVRALLLDGHGVDDRALQSRCATQCGERPSAVPHRQRRRSSPASTTR